jgi:translocation and assembly module TamB
MTFGVGGGVLIVKDVDLEAAPLNFDLIHVFNGGSLSRDWRGTLTGTVKGRGGPMTRFVVDDARLTFRDAHVAGAVARATGRGTLDIFEPDFTVFHGFDVDVETLDLRTIRYLFPDFPELNGTIAGTGTLDSLWLDVRFSNAELAHMDGPGEPTRVAGRGRITYGEPFIAYDVDLVAGPISFTTLARSYPVIPLRGGYSGTVVARGTLEDMDLDARLTGDGGTMAARGNFDFYEPLYAARATGAVEQLDLRALLQRDDLVSTRLNARVEAGIAGDSLPSLLGRVAVALDRSAVGEILLDPSTARLRFEGGRLVVDTLILATSAAAVRAHGALGLTRAVADSLAFRVIVDSLGGLRPWLAGAATDSLAGYLETEGVARGAIDSLDVRGRLEGHDLFLRGDRAKLLTGSYALADLLRAPRGGASLVLDTLAVAGLGITRASTDLAVDGTGSTRFAVDVLAINESRLTAGGRVERSVAATTVFLDSTRLAVGRGSYRLRAPARLTIDSAGLSVDALELRHDERGWLAIRGALPDSGAVDLAIAADSLSLGDVALLAQLPDTAAGLARLEWRITGTRLAPLMTIGATLTDARLAGARLERLTLRGDYNDRRLAADLALFRGGRRALVATGSLPVDFALEGGRERLLRDSLRGNIRTDSVDLAVLETFSDQLQRATGRLQANVDIGGTWRQPVLTGHLGIENGAVSLANVGVRLQRLNADVALTGDSLHVRRLSMASGEERARGDTAALTGWVSFADFADPRFDLRFSARNFLVIDRPRVATLDISTGSSQPLNLSGSKSAGRLTGSVIVDQGSIAIPELVEKNLIDLSDPELGDVVDTSLYANRRLLDEAPSEFVQNLTLDNVRLVIGEDVWLRSSEANIKLAGQLDVTRGRGERNGDAAQLALAGTLTTERGTYTLNLGLVRPNFTVERGTLRFFGDPDLNPTLDISALHVVRRAGQTNRPDVRIRVTIAGTLAQPELRLSSADEPPIPESDLFSYLVTGEPAFALGGTGEQYTGTAASLALRLGSSWFTSRFQGPFDYVQIQTAGVSGAEARGFLRDPTSAGSIFSNARIGLGWQIRDRTFVSASTGLCQLDPSSQQELLSQEFISNVGLRVEHRFNHGFSTEFSVEPATTDATCGKQSSTILQQTPHQVGFDLFRSWSF